MKQCSTCRFWHRPEWFTGEGQCAHSRSRRGWTGGNESCPLHKLTTKVGQLATETKEGNDGTE